MNFDPFYFPSGSHQLYGALHKPNGKVRGAAVLCAPFAEEQKTTYRAYAQLAAALAKAGWFALQFDYRGTGDSSGAFSDFSPSAAAEDIRAAIDQVRERSGVGRVGLFGLRLGASFAAQLAESRDDIAWLAMWQPVIDGEEFFKLNVKRQMVRQMLIRAAGEKTGAEAQEAKATEQGDVIDLDGYPFARTACDELRHIALPTGHTPFNGPTLLVQVSTSDRRERAMQALANAWRLDDNFRVHVAEPFWNRIGLIDCSNLIDFTVEWLRKQRFV